MKFIKDTLAFLGAIIAFAAFASLVWFVNTNCINPFSLIPWLGSC